jgi:glyoxylate reductase
MQETGKLSGAGLACSSTNRRESQIAQTEECVAPAAYGLGMLEGRIDRCKKVIVNIKTFADGRKPPDRVIPAMS